MTERSLGAQAAIEAHVRYKVHVDVKAKMSFINGYNDGADEIEAEIEHLKALRGQVGPEVRGFGALRLGFSVVQYTLGRSVSRWVENGLGGILPPDDC